MELLLEMLLNNKIGEAMENKNKSRNKIMNIIMVILIIMIISIVVCDIYFVSQARVGYKSKVEQKALVVKVNEKQLNVVLLNEENSLGEYIRIANVSLDKIKNTRFRPGQEILIYYGAETSFSPPELYAVSKIEIEKEKSDIPIPEEALWFYYNSLDKVSVEIDEITQTNMTISVDDKNVIKYKFSNNYRIYKNNELMSKKSNKNLFKQYIDNNNQTLKIQCDWSEQYDELEERRV